MIRRRLEGLRRRLEPLLAGVQGNPGPVDLRGEPALVIQGPGQALPPLERAGPLLRPGEGWAEQVLVASLDEASLSEALRAALHGGRTFHLGVGLGATLTVNRRGALALVGSRGALREAARLPMLGLALRRAGLRLAPPQPTLAATLQATRRAVEVAGAAPEGWRRAPLRVLHVTGRLGPGGAERQLTYVVRAGRAAGVRAEVLTLAPIAGEDAHYAPDLARAGVAVGSLAPHPRWRVAPPLPGVPRDLRTLLARHGSAEVVFALADRLLRDRPHVLHCWLDEPCTAGGLAGLLAGVPRIVLSTRNLSPARLPRLLRPWYRDVYRLLAASPRVVLVANSRAGAADYASWAGIDLARFRVVPNGLPLDELRPLSAGERGAARRAAGYPADAFLVAGVFRLDPEKRPSDFLAAVERARARIPGLRALHMGTGSLAEGFREEARRRGLEGCLRLLGRCERPWDQLRLADACLLTSDAEGCPNVSLESQGLGVPMIVTDSAGSPETVVPQQTGFVCGLGQVEAMAERLVELAEDPVERRRMGAAARAHVEREYSLETMAQRTHALYADPLPAQLA